MAFNLFKKKGITLVAPLKGRCISIKEVKDETFSGGFLGDGIGIEPTDGKVYAPADGEVTTVFPTGHAIGMTTADGVEVLIHIGIDTVKLEGKHFQIKTEVGKQVKQGDLLVEVDIEGIRQDGYDTATPMIVCNTGDYASVEGLTGKDVNPGDDVIIIKK